MPLILAIKGEAYVIKKIIGDEDSRHFLGKLGFVTGAGIIVTAEFGKNLIVLIKGTRVAIAKEMAKKIII